MDEDEKISIKDFSPLKPPLPPLPRFVLTKNPIPPILEVIYYGVTAINHQVNAMDQQINALDNLFRAVDKALTAGGDISKLFSSAPSKPVAKKAVETIEGADKIEQVLTEFIKNPSDNLISKIEELKESTNNKAIRAYLNAIVDAYKEGNKEEATALASGVRRALRAIKGH